MQGFRCCKIIGMNNSQVLGALSCWHDQESCLPNAESCQIRKLLIEEQPYLRLISTLPLFLFVLKQSLT